MSELTAAEPLPLLTEQDLPEGFLREFEAEILGRVPQEKIDAQLRQEKICRIMRQAGSTQLKEGVGQLMTRIDARLYFRMRASFAQSPDDNDWIDDILRDNPEMCAPGYRPARKGDLRHAKTFVGGKPI